MSYASPPIWKLHSHNNIASELYKPTFYGGTATLWIFCLPQRRYSYSTWSSMMELSYQCLNTKTFAQGNKGFTTETLNIFYTICLYIRLVVTLQFASLIIDKDNSYWTWSLVFNSNIPISTHSYLRLLPII